MSKKKSPDMHEFDSRPELHEKLSELDILKQSLDASNQKQKEVFDQMLRLRAEFDNFRKRSEVRVQEARRYGNEEVLLQIIALADTLEQAVQASESTEDMKSLKQGLALVKKQFEKFLNDQGLVPIQTVGKTLDPHKHEALAQEITEDADEGVIVSEIQKGFMMGDRVVRTAKVRVAAKPKDNEKNQIDKKQEEQEHV